MTIRQPSVREYQKPLIEAVAINPERPKPVRLAALIIVGVAAVAGGTWAVATFTRTVEPLRDLVSRKRTHLGPTLVILPGLAD